MPLFGQELVTRTKFIAPVPRRAHLDRERLYARLDEVGEVVLGLVVAGTGYGKSSLLAGYARSRGVALLWYELAAEDADPQVFAVHLAHLVQGRFPGAGDRALAALGKPGGAERHGEAAIDALADALLDHLEAETWLVLDDFHHVLGSPAAALVNRLVARKPPRLHVVLSARTRPDLPDLPRWRVRDEVVMLEQAELAFDAQELAAWLSGSQGLALDPAALAALTRETEGWPMALALAARRLREGGAAGSAGTSADLFDYLAREVLAKLDPATHAFLLAVAPLSRLDPQVCAAVAGRADAAALLRELDERGLFMIPLEQGSYRFHHLFREFLLARLAEAGQLVEARRVAGAALLSAARPEEAVDQWLAAGDLEAAAGVMALVAPALVSQGRFAQLTTWLAALPEDLVERAPALAICQGDACRLAGRFDEALGWYERALAGYGEAPEGRSRALAGQALVFLDTLQPARAAAVLEEAIALAPAERRPELMVLLAENKLNHGDAAGAAALLPQARTKAANPEHEARVRLRTGRLADARALLARAVAGTDPAAGTRAHREPGLVLALIEALEGDAAAAKRLAEEGRALARSRGSAWTEGVAAIRLGHAQLLAGDAPAAERSYQAAIALMGDVARLHVEPLMGLALVAGRRGDMVEAEGTLARALEITRNTGDVWVAAMLALALGGLLAARGDARARAWLALAQADYEACGDAFGRALVALATARLALAEGAAEAPALVAVAIAALRMHDHGRTLGRPTLLGFEDEHAVRDFFARAMTAGVEPAALMPWVQALGLWTPRRKTDRLALPLEPAAVPPSASAPPLAVYALGGFRVLRDGVPLGERVWSREKARQLFQLFVTFRGQRLTKPRIIDLLWPELAGDSADGIFRVALNALNKALEPDRPSGAATRFVVRDGTTYGLGPEVWVDATAFEERLEMAKDAPDERAAEHLRAALACYEGPFLPDADPMETVGERERLATRFTDGALKLARTLARLGDDAGCAEWAQRLIARDQCAEEAYRLLMIAQYRQGDRGLAIRTYDRCVVALSDELDVDPMPETQVLYETIVAARPVSP